MLFFIYNKDVVSVLVCHNIAEGEFVLQVPFFPPIETIEDYKDKERCLDIVKKSIFSEDIRQQSQSKKVQIQIKSVNSWKMEAVVADTYINKDGFRPHTFLAGDSAHAFPPSGGFGMNTGIGDCFNLAHKIAFVEQNLDLQKEI